MKKFMLLATMGSLVGSCLFGMESTGNQEVEEKQEVENPETERERRFNDAKEAVLSLLILPPEIRDRVIAQSLEIGHLPENERRVMIDRYIADLTKPSAKDSQEG